MGSTIAINHAGTFTFPVFLKAAASHIPNKTAILQSMSHTEHCNYFLTFYVALCTKFFRPNLGKASNNMDWDCRICPSVSLLIKKGCSLYLLWVTSRLFPGSDSNFRPAGLKPWLFIGFIWFSWKQKYMGGFPKPQRNLYAIPPYPPSSVEKLLSSN